MAASPERILYAVPASTPSGRHRMKSILIVDPEPDARTWITAGLKPYFGLIESAGGALDADALRGRCHFDLIIVNVRLPELAGTEWVSRIRSEGDTAVVIFVALYAELDMAIAALRVGAADFFVKPYRVEQIAVAAERCLDAPLPAGRDAAPGESASSFDSTGLVGDCEHMRALCDVIKRVAPMPTTVLLEGESGTGKELAARAIHVNSGRSGPFVPINCSAVSAELLESELFGHVKGAFTGAHQAREGLFSYAEGGTLFLDEIGELPKPMQGHLLRALEERAVRPVGSNREMAVDVRIVAATNRDLAEEVKQGRFREDLYFRLNVLALRMPALRERRDDIPRLVCHFVDTLAPQLGVAAPAIGEPELMRLQAHDWPGNVRELKNVVERCLLLGAAPSQCLKGATDSASAGPAEAAGEEYLLEVVEKRHILRVLDLEDGNKSAAARRLGISRKTLERKLQAWESGIRPD